MRHSWWNDSSVIVRFGVSLLPPYEKASGLGFFRSVRRTTYESCLCFMFFFGRFGECVIVIVVRDALIGTWW